MVCWLSLSGCTLLQFFHLAVSDQILPQNRKDPFSELYTTNAKEFEDYPITFDQPIPEWLKGTLVINGFGRFEHGKRRVIHVFDAFAKLSSWKFPGNGSALFSTKFIKSAFYTQTMATKDDIAPFLMFQGVEPPFGFIKSIEALVNGLDNMNVNIYPYNKVEDNNSSKGYYALTDFWKMYEFNCSNLDTIGPVNAPIPGKAGHAAIGFLSFVSTAHPLPEFGKNSSLLFLSKMSLIPWEKNTVNLVRIHEAQKREIVASIPVGQLPYMHSFSTTKNYGILFFCPIYINVLKVAETTHPFDGLDWYGDRKTKVKVINLKTGEVISLETETSFVMHHVNAYEEKDGTVVVDVIGYDDPGFIKSMTMENLLDDKKRNTIPFTAQIKRHILDLKTKKVVVQTFPTPKGKEFLSRFDLPKINENYRSKPYCFTYGEAIKADSKNFVLMAVVKKDVCQKGRDRYYMNADEYVSEPVFIPSPNGKEEDDGILLLPVLKGVENKTYLYIMDAKTLQIISKAELPTNIPYTLHGSFFPEIH